MRFTRSKYVRRRISPNRITHIRRVRSRNRWLCNIYYTYTYTMSYRYKGQMVLWNDSRFQLGLPLQ